MPGSSTLGSPGRSALISALIHAIAILAVVFLAASNHSPMAKLLPVQDTAVYLPPPSRLMRGGGGGRRRSPLPVPKRPPSKATPRVFTMPVRIARAAPPLVETAPAELTVSALETPSADLAHIGDLLGHAGPMSGGPGGGGGLGDGKGPGAGGKGGPGIGDDGVIGIGGLPKNATKPELLSKTEPEYSEEARMAKAQGTVVLSIIVTVAGGVSDLRVIRGLGLGLDERALDAVRQWRFRSATVDGKPAAARAVVEVSFRLM
jgi:TonB family protein